MQYTVKAIEKPVTRLTSCRVNGKAAVQVHDIKNKKVQLLLMEGNSYVYNRIKSHNRK